MKHYKYFSEKANKSMHNALQEALRYYHPHIETDHCILGIMLEGTSIGSHILKGYKITVESIRFAIEQDKGYGNPDRERKTLGLSHSLEESILRAKRSAYPYRGKPIIEPRDLIYGILQHEQNTGAQILIQNGVTSANFENEIEKYCIDT